MNTNVSSNWKNGNLYFYDKNKDTICYFDGTNRKLVFPDGSTVDFDGAANFNTVQFDLSPTGSLSEGEMRWSSDNGTVEIGLPGGNVFLQLGEEQLVKSKNVSSTGTINGKPFYLSGASGSNPEMSLANASGSNAAKTLVIATEDININSSGYFTTFGLVRDMDTSFGTDGQEVFLDATDGGLTVSKLDYPNMRVKIGYIMRSHASEGVLFVTISADQWLKRFQAMQEPTGFTLGHTDLMGDMSFVNGTRTFTIEPKSGQDYFSFWVNGREHRKTSAVDIIIADTEGIHIIYFDDDGAIAELVNPNTGVAAEAIRTQTLMTIIYWDSSASEQIYFGEERHGIQMDGSTHSYLHFVNGLAYLSGLGLNTMSVDGTGITVDAQFGIDAGSVSDEDIYDSISAVTSTTGLPIYYMLGASADWQKHTESGFSVRTFGGTDATRLAYNQFTGGAWQLTEVANNDFVLCHIFATTDISNPMIAIMGQNDYLNKVAARAGAEVEIHSLILDDLLFPEIRPIATVIFKTNTSYANDVNAYVVSTDDGDDYIDWRNENISRVGLTTSDHNNLSGLQGGATGEYYHLTSAQHTGFVEKVAAPASAGATGVAGTIAWDTGYIYICVTTDTWLRAAIATW